MGRTLWLIPLALAFVGGGFALRARYRRRSSASFSVEHVSGEWLAHARGREQHDR